MGSITWRVQYRKDATDHLVRYPTPEEAIEAACLLIDEGCDVYRMGTVQFTTSIGRDEIARIYAFWTRPRTPFGGTSN